MYAHICTHVCTYTHTQTHTRLASIINKAAKHQLELQSIICIHLCVQTCMHMYTHICKYTHAHTHTPGKHYQKSCRTPAPAPIHIYTHIYVHIHVCIRIRTYIHIYIHTHTHTRLTSIIQKATEHQLQLQCIHWSWS